MKVLVTGGSGDIGKAICLLLGKQGHQVAVHAFTSFSKAKTIAQKNSGIAVQADLTKDQEVKKMADTLLSKWGTIDAIINTAGFPINSETKKYWDGTFEKITPKMFQNVFEVDTLGTIRVIQAFLPIMKKKKHGKIINFSSPSAMIGHSEGFPFNVAKGGILSLTKGLAQELAKYQITVNAIAPSSIETHWIDNYSVAYRKKIKSRIPLGRLGKPEDVAHLVSFLLSSEADWLTGKTYVVDGGEVLL